MHSTNSLFLQNVPIFFSEKMPVMTATNLVEINAVGKVVPMLGLYIA